MNNLIPPPQNIEAEQEVIGTMLQFYDPRLVHVAQAAGLKRGDFYRHVHEAIYRAILVLHARGEHVDVRTVAHFLAKEHTKEPEPRSFLEYVGGLGHLECVASYAVATGFRERCRIVAEDGRWRRWLHALYDAIESVHGRNDSAFWDAIGRVREEAPEGAELPSLRVVEGGRAA